MNSMRKLILSGDNSFDEAKKAYSEQKIFDIEGDMYKKDHYPDQPEENRLWLNRRNIWIGCNSGDFKTLYGKNLSKKIGGEFLSIAPVYNFLMKAEQIRED